MTAFAARHASSRTPATVTRLDYGTTTLVRLAGDLDVMSTARFDGELRDATTGPGGRVVVDLSRVTFLDSATVRALVRARRRMDGAGRSLVTRGAEGQPRRLLDLALVHYGLRL